MIDRKPCLQAEAYFFANTRAARDPGENHASLGRYGELYFPIHSNISSLYRSCVILLYSSEGNNLKFFYSLIGIYMLLLLHILLIKFIRMHEEGGVIRRTTQPPYNHYTRIVVGLYRYSNKKVGNRSWNELSSLEDVSAMSGSK